MNLKGLTAPLTEKIAFLIELIQENIDSVKEQTNIQKQILAKLELMQESINEKNICSTEKRTD